ncbi:MAG: sensor histidine kinase [Methylibium sp.]|uniref:histidine kinase n=1 Tax=Methylibium petroleiphilum (strain ATCC BAA-1232 / LMG 22953 / PM1) TaxID=420662 RepID=A2SBV0_METPP|nr:MULTISPECIES: sensor histidine kinase [Methylibium]ABM93039.1 putative transmembrane sensor histidine kinase transcription regulator protein [Methylibium petroleiphilum PM1]EWS59877.1 Sensor protein QseC [Methylibium sp. T29-B]
MNTLRGQRSLFGEILDWMLAPLLLLWPMSVALTWLVAQNIANRPYDRALGEMARALSQQVSVDQGRVAFALPPGADQLLRADEADQIYFQVLGARGEYVGGDHTLPVPREDDVAAVGEVRYRDDEVHNEAVRVAYLWVAMPAAPRIPGATSPALVQVAETLGKRSQLATEIIKGVILPQFVILPLAVLLVWLALARGIAPLNELQQRIRRRAADDLSPIDEMEAPEEVSPLVRAINDLLERLDRSLATQRRFLADAAHQLKTPLAGLRTQAEIAQREIDAGEREPEALKRSLQQIALSSQRAAHMVNQLLAMARAEDRELAARVAEVRLARLATETVRDFVPRALEKRIDLGYEGPGADGETAEPQRSSVLGHALLLREMIRNLVDNALHYTPPGGTVTVRVVSDPFGQVVVLQVEDSGPGIPAAERELVFQPFYRALGTDVDGSGLGLAIVAEIARQHGATLTLDDTREGPVPEGSSPGARFTVRFAAWPADRLPRAAPLASGTANPA